MKRFLNFGLILFVCWQSLAVAQTEQPKKAIQKITPGQVIVPFQKMRRIWGELVSVDLETRTGTFRAEGEDKIYRFEAMPYAEMLHHATQGYLSDFKIGERAIFRMHVNEDEEWYWLTYIQDEMNMLNGHKEYYFVESIDEASGRIGVTWAKGDMTFVREKDLFFDTNKETRYWKNGEPAKFTDIKVGGKLRTKSRGNGKGRSRIAWHVFLDDASLLQFRDEQIAIQEARVKKYGAVGYVDRVEGPSMDLTMFGSGISAVETLRTGMKVKIAPAAKNLRQAGDAAIGTVVKISKKGHSRPLTVELDSATAGFEVTGLAVLWVQ